MRARYHNSQIISSITRVLERVITGPLRIRPLNADYTVRGITTGDYNDRYVIESRFPSRFTSRVR